MSRVGNCARPRLFYVMIACTLVSAYSASRRFTPSETSDADAACHRQRTMPRRGSNADRLLPVASCLLTFALALSLRMFWVLPQDTAPVAAPMKFSAEAYWEDELLVPHPPHPPAQPSAAALTHDRVAWS